MKPRHLILAAALSLFACKEEAKPTVPTATVVGELHYRNACVNGLAAPVAPFQVSPINAGPFVWVTNAAGLRVGDVSSTDAAGHFKIGAIVNVGTYHINLLMGELDRFYTGAGGVTTRIPLDVKALPALIDLGKICADNEAPKLTSVLTTWAGHSHLITATSDATLHFLQSQGAVTIETAVMDADADTVHVTFVATEGELKSAGSVANWSWTEKINSTVLQVELSDRFGGVTRVNLPVQMHEHEIRPTYVNAVRNLGILEDRQQLLYTKSSEDATWSTADAGLVSVIHASQQPVHLSAVAPEVLPASNPVTVSATVSITNATGDVRMGIFMGNKVSGQLALVVHNGSGLAQWELRDDFGILVSGRVSSIVANSFELLLSLDPELGLTRWTVRDVGANKSFVGIVGANPFGVSEGLQVGILTDSMLGTTNNTLSGVVKHLSIWGGSRTGYRVPFRHGIFNGLAYGTQGLDLGHAIVNRVEYSGMDFLNIEMGSNRSLDQAHLRRTSDQYLYTELVDDLASLPTGLEVDGVTHQALVIFEVGGTALY